MKRLTGKWTGPLLGVAAVAVLALVIGLLSNSAGVSSADAQAAPTPCPELTPAPGGPTTPTPLPPLNPPQCLGPLKVPTTAQLGGGSGATLKIECKWELPDMTPYDTAMSYGSVGSRDDTPQTLADAPACDPATQPVAAENRRHMMGVVPNAANYPNQRQYEKWVAVESTNVGDIVDVFWKVWEPFVAATNEDPQGPNCTNPVQFPAGTGPQYCFKYQHHATADLLPPTGTDPLIKVNCAAFQTAPLSEMLKGAVETGQMTQAEADNIINQCFQGLKAVYRVQEEISKDQPCGEYRVEVTAVNSAGAAFTNVNFFDVLCFIHLSLDFASVDWGTIQNNASSLITGDMIFNPGATNVACVGPSPCVPPTVMNTGNASMYVETMFDPLVLTSDPTKSITTFDSKLRAAWQTNPATLEVIDPQPARSWYCFGNHPIGSDSTGKVDLSVHPVNAQQGTYNGSLYVVARFDCVSPHSGLHTTGHPVP